MKDEIGQAKDGMIQSRKVMKRGKFLNERPFLGQKMLFDRAQGDLIIHYPDSIKAELFTYLLISGHIS